MSARIGPDNFNKEGTTYLNNHGRQYSNSMMVDALRMRALEGAPNDNITQFALNYASNIYFEGNHQTKNVAFCVIQRDETKIPVFMLPATEDKTASMTDEERCTFMQNTFDTCYKLYCDECVQQKKMPIEKKYCAATSVVGTKTIFGGNHFTAIIKSPGDKRWSHVDPTSFLGPQKFNRKQCGGYSSLIEIEAVIHYSLKSIESAKKDEKDNIVLQLLKQFFIKLSLKLNTWFAGARNKTNYDKDHKHSLVETTYGEIADFGAGEMAKSFENTSLTNAESKSNLVVASSDSTIDDDYEHISSSSNLRL